MRRYVTCNVSLSLCGMALWQVTKRVDTAEGQWAGWNWRTEGDMMVNGAFFVPSGEGLEDIYDKASSTDPKSSALVDVLTQNAGVFGDPRYVRWITSPSPRELFLFFVTAEGVFSLPLSDPPLLAGMRKYLSDGWTPPPLVCGPA